MATRNLDIGMVRSFLLIAGGHSFAETADIVGRSPSAVSLQIQRLEEDLGARLLFRSNRETSLTLAGERFLGLARGLVRINDEAVAGFRPSAEDRPIRFGITQDFAEGILSDILGRFAREHPRVELTLRVDRSAALIAGVHGGELDLAVAIRREDATLGETLLEAPMLWIGREGRPEPESGLPLVLFEAPCSFRAAALDALSRAGRDYRIRFTSPSLPGLRSAVAAGLGVTARTAHFLAPGLTEVAGLPALPTVAFAAYRPASAGGAALDDLVEIARRALNGRPV
ncbi:LysR substrate-binding domain-containing protein [Arenibaculum pallidiluteum]|uniref:LysR substrate-binding domain-containing protein n=1 Tax=Arenibaculum pallidiluteum TaxID=2812559 RepID=UPI001A95BA68|nr:LysR substrate-binding domain-containing protein [Arenibaculum pallidiluteum]